MANVGFEQQILLASGKNGNTKEIIKGRKDLFA